MGTGPESTVGICQLHKNTVDRGICPKAQKQEKPRGSGGGAMVYSASIMSSLLIIVNYAYYNDSDHTELLK